jgi:hypothetical protein
MLIQHVVVEDCHYNHSPVVAVYRLAVVLVVDVYLLALDTSVLYLDVGEYESSLVINMKVPLFD